MNAVVELKPAGALAATQDGGRMAVKDIIQHVAVVQEVMRAVMKPDVHYGVIPGTDKPTLYKAGAEVLCMVFRIASSYEIEDLSTSDTVRYRVTCTGTHQATGTVLGAGMGEASSGEEKYKWRKAYEPEYNETPINMRRKKTGFNKQKKEQYSTFQVRTEHADLANTVLKMANKRAHMAMVLSVTAASDCFAQDLEDMDAALRDHLTRHEGDEQPEKTAPQLPEFTREHLEQRAAKIGDFYTKGKTADDVIAFYSLKSHLPDAMKQAIRDMAPKAGNVEDATPKVSYATLADRLTKCADADTAALILDEARALPQDQQDGLSRIHAEKFGN